MQANDLRPGMVIKFNNELHSVLSATHRTPGNLRAFVQVKMRNLRNAATFEHRYASTDNVDRVSLDEQKMEYLYAERDDYFFMNTETYEQIHLTSELLGDATSYLIGGMMVAVTFYENNPISVDLPPSVELTVVETEPGMKGASVSNVGKPAKMETGLIVTVPPFIGEGEKIRVSTTDGTYQARA
jgi:elongation factor P